VLGFVGTDDSGLAGLEHLYDKEIRGKPGEIVALTDARRSRYGEAETRDGRPRGRVARAVARLGRAVRGRARARRRDGGAPREVRQRRRHGSLERRDPRDGVGARFDPNEFQQYPADSRRNRVIADCYEPGSTFKIVTGAVALERGSSPGRDHRHRRRDDPVANTTIREADHHRYGALTLAGSSSTLEHRDHPRRPAARARRLYEGASAFGVGRPTGVDLPGENSGIFRPLPRWSALSNASISMGQEVSLNALQLARHHRVVANGGYLVQPHLVTRVVEPGRPRARRRDAEPVRVVSAETRRVDLAHPRRRRRPRHRRKAAIPGFAVAGKTGTAQKAGVGGYIAGRHVPNFAGFAPAEHPRCVAVVVLEEPQGTYYAADVAAPLFQRVVSQALGILRVRPREQQVPASVLAEAAPPRSVEYPRRGAVALPRRPHAPLHAGARPRRVARAARRPHAERRRHVRAPGARDVRARRALARIQGTGFVVAQDPPAGSPLRAGSVHTLFLADARAAGLGEAGTRGGDAAASAGSVRLVELAAAAAGRRDRPRPRECRDLARRGRLPKGPARRPLRRVRGAKSTARARRPTRSRGARSRSWRTGAAAETPAASRGSGSPPRRGARAARGAIHGDPPRGSSSPG
jgi:membrane peptidoglycan carboxypeptidase